MEIYFLTPEQAYPRLQDLYINVGCTRAHRNAITSFTPEQKNTVLMLMREIENLPIKIGLIEFVLLERGVYWDFPFTWGKTMIMMTPKIFSKPRNVIKKILVHEWVHLDQRRHPQKYEIFYQTLGFEKRHINFGALQPYLLRNPDADRYEWIWISEKGGPIYVPVALIRSCKFSTVLLEFRANEVLIHDIKEIPAYYERFGVKRQLYHPNEITAHLIADLLIDQVQHASINQSHLRRLYY